MPYKKNDIVSCDGTDRHIVMADENEQGQIFVKCIEAPKSGWCSIGDEELNLSYRYYPVEIAVSKSRYQLAIERAPI